MIGMKRIKNIGLNCLTRKRIIIFVVSISLFLNFLTFLSSLSYPTTLGARDFSAYYFGAWKLLHNPEKVYTEGYPFSTTYKYLPSFLLMMLPFMLLNYQTAFFIFDIFQFLLLPIMALMLHRMFSNKHVLVIALILIIVLIQPLPPFYIDRIDSTWVQFSFWVDYQNTFSRSYYSQWGNANAKVFITFLLVLSLYLAYRKKSYLSGAVFALAFFDPRFAVISIPLAILYNQGRVQKFLVAFAITFVSTNSIVLYSTIGAQFMHALSENSQTPMFSYGWIPLYTIIALTAVNFGNLKTFFIGGWRKRVLRKR